MSLRTRILIMAGGFVLMALLVTLFGLATLSDYRRMMNDYGRAYENAYMGERLNHLISNSVMESRGLYLARSPEEVKTFTSNLKTNLNEIDTLVDQWQAIHPTVDLSPIKVRASRFIAQRHEIIRISEAVSRKAAEDYGLTTRTDRIAFQAGIEKIVRATRADLAHAKAEAEVYDRQRVIGFAFVALSGVGVAGLLSLWLIRHFIMREIERSQHAEEAREKLLKELMISNTELERFAYVASHDMQEPVRIVSIFSQMVAIDYADQLDDKGRQYLGIIRDSSQHMLTLVQDLLNYSRLEPEAEPMAPVDLEHQLKHVRANLGALIQSAEARIEAPANLPGITGNPIQIQRLLQNLIANAIKYRREDETPVITIGAQEEAAQWCITVSDNGMGIAPEFTARIFEPFRRLHTWEKIQGSGLGLSICRKIVEHHGGRIWVDSVPGVGSTFSFTIAKPEARLQRPSIAALRATAMLSVA